VSHEFAVTPIEHHDGIRARKLKHVEACLREDVGFATRTTGFERVDLPYVALPGTSLAAVDLATTFLGRPLCAPVFIEAMTGGAEYSGTINRNLAIAAQRLGIGLMLGSQRVMLADPAARVSFEIRGHAPDVPIIGNLGVAQLNKGYGAAEVVRAIESIHADALAFHTNPLQEAMQGGDTDFSGLVGKLRDVVAEVPYPLLLKEVGHGLGGAVAHQVADIGLAALDVAGAGGTSWARVEQYVRHGYVGNPELAEWGIATAEALVEVRAELPDIPIIASGGVRSGVDAAKALAMGADVVGVARPLLRPAMQSADAVTAWLESFLWELRVAMYGSGARDVAAARAIRLRCRPGLPGHPQPDADPLA
jgi:isopentenyl-diphosphate Delta-isomerase